MLFFLKSQHTITESVNKYPNKEHYFNWIHFSCCPLAKQSSFCKAAGCLLLEYECVQQCMSTNATFEKKMYTQSMSLVYAYPSFFLNCSIDLTFCPFWHSLSGFSPASSIVSCIAFFFLPPSHSPYMEYKRRDCRLLGRICYILYMFVW